MGEPLIVSIPHRLGKQEAVRRLKIGVHEAAEQFGQWISLDEEAWSDDRLTFRATALRQHMAGTVDVMDDCVRLEVTLPWLLARVGKGMQEIIVRRGALLLEKK